MQSPPLEKGDWRFARGNGHLQPCFRFPTPHSALRTPHSALSPGFTLLELLLVLIIVSLMFSTLFIALENPLLRGDLKLAGRMIVNEVTRARAEAAYTNKDLALRFNLEKNLMYQVDLKPTAQGGFENQEEILMRSKALPPGVLLMDLVIGAREKIQFGEADVRVFGNGTMDRALIHIRDEDNDVLTLTLNPLTGDVTIQEGYVDERKSMKR